MGATSELNKGHEASELDETKFDQVHQPHHHHLPHEEFNDTTTSLRNHLFSRSGKAKLLKHRIRNPHKRKKSWLQVLQQDGSPPALSKTDAKREANKVSAELQTNCSSNSWDAEQQRITEAYKDTNCANLFDSVSNCRKQHKLYKDTHDAVFARGGLQDKYNQDRADLSNTLNQVNEEKLEWEGQPKALYIKERSRLDRENGVIHAYLSNTKTNGIDTLAEKHDKDKKSLNGALDKMQDYTDKVKKHAHPAEAIAALKADIRSDIQVLKRKIYDRTREIVASYSDALHDKDDAMGALSQALLDYKAISDRDAVSKIQDSGCKPLDMAVASDRNTTTSSVKLNFDPTDVMTKQWAEGAGACKDIVAVSATRDKLVTQLKQIDTKKQQRHMNMELALPAEMMDELVPTQELPPDYLANLDGLVKDSGAITQDASTAESAKEQVKKSSESLQQTIASVRCGLKSSQENIYKEIERMLGGDEIPTEPLPMNCPAVPPENPVTTLALRSLLESPTAADDFIRSFEAQLQTFEEALQKGKGDVVGTPEFQQYTKEMRNPEWDKLNLTIARMGQGDSEPLTEFEKATLKKRQQRSSTINSFLDAVTKMSNDFKGHLEHVHWVIVERADYRKDYEQELINKVEVAVDKMLEEQHIAVLQSKLQEEQNKLKDSKKNLQEKMEQYGTQVATLNSARKASIGCSEKTVKEQMLAEKKALCEKIKTYQTHESKSGVSKINFSGGKISAGHANANNVLESYKNIQTNQDMLDSNKAHTDAYTGTRAGIGRFKNGLGTQNENITMMKNTLERYKAQGKIEDIGPIDETLNLESELLEEIKKKMQIASTTDVEYCTGFVDDQAMKANLKIASYLEQGSELEQRGRVQT
jgi:hypothetical protein